MTQTSRKPSAPIAGAIGKRLMQQRAGLMRISAGQVIGYPSATVLGERLFQVERTQIVSTSLESRGPSVRIFLLGGETVRVRIAQTVGERMISLWGRAVTVLRGMKTTTTGDANGDESRLSERTPYGETSCEQSHQ